MAQSPAGSVALGELPSVFLSEEIPLFAGAFTQSLLVGVMLCQLVHYSNSSWATDRVLTRAFVSLIVVIVLLKFGSEVANVEYQLVRNFDVLQTPVLVKVGLICSFFPILLAQLWLLERTHRITLNKKVTAVGAVLILLSAVAFVGEIVARLRTMANEEGVFAIRLWITLYAVATSVSTSFTSVAISWSLYQSRSTASNVRLIALLTGSIVASIEACIPACLGSIGMALSALIAPHTLWYAAFQMNLCVLYAMSVLFVLNSRVRIAMQADEQEFKNSNSLAAMQEAGRCAPRGRRATFGRVTIDYAVDVEVKVEQGEKEELPPFFPGLVDESVSVSAPTDPRLYHENFDRGFDA